MVYTLIETGMRREAVTNIDLVEVDFNHKTISVIEKGETKEKHKYKVSDEGLEAIKNYIEHERSKDNKKFDSPALFLPAGSRPKKQNITRLTTWTINKVWNTVAQKAGVKGKTPHSARHAMGKHIIDKTGNPSAVQKQLGHKNVAYSLQYTRITDREMEDVINDRG
ncbi:tyrosine-type recombinase/integrase [candidate division CSSED10-310 bacterium]|uniref:Tyrosine-type recombinase/integrase n=1 Tax=candidate division CSSED10-310 bacterium TaxID=2855610 RepID=A0ABV6YXG7_UNCC1